MRRCRKLRHLARARVVGSGPAITLRAMALPPLSDAERDANLVRLAKRLHRYPVNGRRRSLREVPKALADAGFLASSGKLFGAAAVARMVSVASLTIDRGTP